jgi:hypothetical protein
MSDTGVQQVRNIPSFTYYRFLLENKKSAHKPRFYCTTLHSNSCGIVDESSAIIESAAEITGGLQVPVGMSFTNLNRASLFFFFLKK